MPWCLPFGLQLRIHLHFHLYHGQELNCFLYGFFLFYQLFCLHVDIRGPLCGLRGCLDGQDGKHVFKVRGEKCYGATNNALELTISSVSSTGQVKGNFKVLYHGHPGNHLNADVDTCDGDAMVAISDSTSTFSTGGFKVFGEIGSHKNRFKGNLSITESGDSLRVTLELVSYLEDGATVTDAYLLTKKK